MCGEAREIDNPICFDEHVKQVQDAVALANRLFDQAKTARLRLRFQLGQRPEAAILILIGMENAEVVEIGRDPVEIC